MSKLRWLLARCVVPLALVLLTPGPPAAAGEPVSLNRSFIELMRQKGFLTEEEYEKLTTQAAQEEKTRRWTEKIEAGYRNGLYVKTPDDRFLLRLNGYVQGQFLYRDATNGVEEATFNVRRARLVLSGNAFYPWLQFYNQLTLEGNVSNTLMRDYFLQATYFKAVQPRVGQSKLPFDREFLTSAANLQLVERSIASDEFSIGRDVGVQVAGQLADGLVRYAVGAYNGSGANRVNVNRSLIGVGRVVFAPLGPLPANLASTSWYAQSALARPKKPLVEIGFAAAGLPDLEPGERGTLGQRLGSTSVVPVKSDVVQLTSDLAFQWRGFSLEAAYHWRRIDPLRPLGGQELSRTDAQGYYVQAGYFLNDLLPAIPEGLEVAARYSWVNPDSPVNRGKNSQQAITGGLNYYIVGHRLKVQADYEYRTQERATATSIIDHRARAQVTLQF